MKILSKVATWFTGDAVRATVDLVKEYWPPDISPEKRAELEIKAMQLAASRDVEGHRAMLESENAVTARISQLEGTAQDLRAIPIAGPIVIFLRGLQRLCWGYGTFYVDVMWFSGRWQLEGTQESAMWIINILVLGFLFGERAIQNVMPLVTEAIAARTKGRN